MTANGRAIGFILAGVACISVNDMLIKFLSGGYPLHQMVLVRSVIGIIASFGFLALEGGLDLLRTERPALHALRAGLIVTANLTFFAALAVMPLGAATALFFVAPLFITLLSVPLLAEPVGRTRLIAVFIGFGGVAVMMAPGVDWGGIGRWNLALPVVAAGCYAGVQILTRKLGTTSAASAMAIYIQATFIVVSLGFFLAAGDGRFAADVDHEALVFLLRAWVWPPAGDLWIFGVLGLMSAGVGYALSQAYRLGAPSVVAPYEYVLLPMAVFWGWLVFDEVPRSAVWVGIALIAGAGLFVFARERAVEPPAGRGRWATRGR